MFDRGDVTLADLEEAIDGLTRGAFKIRAGRLGDYLGEVDPDENAARLRTIFEALTRDRGDEPVLFTVPSISPAYARTGLRRRSSMWISSAVSVAASTLMSAHKTFRKQNRRRLAMPHPVPIEPAPVTRATLSLIRSAMVQSSSMGSQSGPNDGLDPR